MGGAELLALSLGLSIATASAAWAGGRLVETFSADPRLRDRLWGMALILPALPPLAVGLMLLTPAPVREIAAPAAAATPVVLERLSGTPATVIEPGFALAGLIAMAALTAAGLMVLARAGVMALRAWRLSRLIGQLDQPDANAVEMVEAAARGLSTPAPRIGVSGTTPEPLLVGFARPRLVLPAGLATTADAAVVRAVIAHELAHLKRGDHRALWIEEGLLTLLAFNPLAPALRARRAAAREEACDALALAGAAGETRRAYAETLIEALRSRAGPRPLPALTLTGAGRRTAMYRLKAVMNPAAPAGRRSRLLAGSVALAIATAAGAGSLAVAGERETVVRVRPTAAEAPVARAEEPRVVGMAPQTRRSPETAARAAAEAALSSLTPEQQARFRNPTAAEYRALCASSDPADGGFCAGVIFSQFPRDIGGSGGDICLPAALEEGDEAARRTALGTLVERTRAEIARAPVQPGDRPADLARAALARAYSCGATARADSRPVWLPVALDIDGAAPVLAPDERVRIALLDETRTVLAESLAVSAKGAPTLRLDIALTDREFPPLNGPSRAFTLVGEILGPDGVARFTAEPTTIRLAPGSRRTAQDLSATLRFRPA